MLFSLILCPLVSMLTRVKDEKQVEDVFACYSK